MNRIRTTDLALALASLVLLLAALVWQLPWSRSEWYVQTFSTEVVAHMDMVDPANRRAAHQFALLALCIAVLAGWRIAASTSPYHAAWRPVAAAMWRLKRGAAALLLIPLAAAYAWSLPEASLLNIPDFAFGLNFFPSSFSYLAMATGSAAIVLAVAALERPAPLMRAGILAAALAYFALAMLPGLLRPLPTFYIGGPLMLSMDSHHGILFGDSVRIADGQVPFRDMHIYYGILRPVALAIWLKAGGTMDFGSELRLVQAFQVLLCALVAVAWWLHSRRRPAHLLLGLALLVPWFHTTHAAIIFPNASAWRLIGLPAGVAILVAVSRSASGTRAALLLGAAGGTLLLNNPETGMAVTAGYAAYLLLRAEDMALRALLRPAMAMGAGIAAALAAFLALYRIGLGPLPSTEVWLNSVSFVVQSVSGFAGRRFYFDPLALLMFSHAMLLAIGAGLARACGALSTPRAVRASVAVMLLVWFAYYVNGTMYWYLAAMLPLYVFLLPDLLSLRAASGNLRRRIAAMASILARPGPALFCAVLGPAILAGNFQLWSAQESHGMLLGTPEARNAVSVSGVPLRPEIGNAILRKAGFLRARAAESSLVYLTANSHFLPMLTRVHSGITMRDAYFETFTKADFDRTLAEIARKAPKVILFDAEGTAIVSPEPQLRYLRRVRDALSPAYALQRVEDGWEVWERR